MSILGHGFFEVDLQYQTIGECSWRIAAAAGRELAELPCIDDAWVLVEGDRIAGYGAMRGCRRGWRR